MMKPSVAVVAELLRTQGRGVVALTGAGISTASGIPDYRSPNGLYRRKDFKPLTWQRFKQSETERKRYWARSMLGYSTMSSALPNEGHEALQSLADMRWVTSIVTQNVDGLHHFAANSAPHDADEWSTAYLKSRAPLVELHGNIHMTRCMQCSQQVPRRVLQRLLQERNAGLVQRVSALKAAASKDDEARPDGDYAADESVAAEMRLVPCGSCGADLRPDVVLFGENVPLTRVEHTFELVRNSSALLCCGTSLQVYSAFRFVEFASKLGTPIVIATHGVTRGDHLATLKIDVSAVSEFLKDVCSELKTS